MSEKIQLITLSNNTYRLSMGMKGIEKDQNHFWWDKVLESIPDSIWHSLIFELPGDWSEVSVYRCHDFGLLPVISFVSTAGFLSTAPIPKTWFVQ